MKNKTKFIESLIIIEKPFTKKRCAVCGEVATTSFYGGGGYSCGSSECERIEQYKYEKDH